MNTRYQNMSMPTQIKSSKGNFLKTSQQFMHKTSSSKDNLKDWEKKVLTNKKLSISQKEQLDLPSLNTLKTSKDLKHQINKSYQNQRNTQIGMYQQMSSMLNYSSKNSIRTDTHKDRINIEYHTSNNSKISKGDRLEIKKIQEWFNQSIEYLKQQTESQQQLQIRQTYEACLFEIIRIIQKFSNEAAQFILNIWNNYNEQIHIKNQLQKQDFNRILSEYTDEIERQKVEFETMMKEQRQYFDSERTELYKYKIQNQKIENMNQYLRKKWRQLNIKYLQIRQEYLNLKYNYQDLVEENFQLTSQNNNYQQKIENDQNQLKQDELDILLKENQNYYKNLLQTEKDRIQKLIINSDLYIGIKQDIKWQEHQDNQDDSGIFLEELNFELEDKCIDTKDLIKTQSLGIDTKDFVYNKSRQVQAVPFSFSRQAQTINKQVQSTECQVNLQRTFEYQNQTSSQIQIYEKANELGIESFFCQLKSFHLSKYNIESLNIQTNMYFDNFQKNLRQIIELFKIYPDINSENYDQLETYIVGVYQYYLSYLQQTEKNIEKYNYKNTNVKIDLHEKDIEYMVLEERQQKIIEKFEKLVKVYKQKLQIIEKNEQEISDLNKQIRQLQPKNQIQDKQTKSNSLKTDFAKNLAKVFQKGGNSPTKTTNSFMSNLIRPPSKNLSNASNEQKKKGLLSNFLQPQTAQKRPNSNTSKQSSASKASQAKSTKKIPSSEIQKQQMSKTFVLKLHEASNKSKSVSQISSSSNYSINSLRLSNPPVENQQSLQNFKTSFIRPRISNNNQKSMQSFVSDTSESQNSLEKRTSNNLLELDLQLKIYEKYNKLSNILRTHTSNSRFLKQATTLLEQIKYKKVKSLKTTVIQTVLKTFSNIFVSQIKNILKVKEYQVQHLHILLYENLVANMGINPQAINKYQKIIYSCKFYSSKNTRLRLYNQFLFGNLDLYDFEFFLNLLIELDEDNDIELAKKLDQEFYIKSQTTFELFAKYFKDNMPLEEFEMEFRLLKNKESQQISSNKKQVKAIDIDIVLDVFLKNYQILKKQAMINYRNLFLAVDFNQQNLIDINQFRTLFKQLESQKYFVNPNKPEEIFSIEADLQDKQGIRYMSFERFYQICIDYELFDQEKQKNFVKNSIFQNLENILLNQEKIIRDIKLRMIYGNKMNQNTKKEIQMIESLVNKDITEIHKQTQSFYNNKTSIQIQMNGNYEEIILFSLNILENESRSICAQKQVNNHIADFFDDSFSSNFIEWLSYNQYRLLETRI